MANNRQLMYSDPPSHRTPDGNGASKSEVRLSVPQRVLDTTLRVTTPENISFEYQIAGPFRRILAYLLDVLVSVVGYLIFALLVSLLFSFVLAPLAATLGIGSLVQTIAEILTGLMLVGYFIVYWFYGALTETYFNGQTLGKRWTRLRVLSTNGHSIDGVQATLRNFFRLLDIAPIVSFSSLLQLETQIPWGMPTCLFGLVIMTFSRKFQRVGDLVANTVVVSESLKRQPELAVFTDERVPGLAELIPAGFVVPPSMARTIADYTDQRRNLPFQRAAEIASHLAAPLIDKMGLLPDTDHDLFICALYYKTFITPQGTEDVEFPVGPASQPGQTIEFGKQPVASDIVRSSSSQGVE